jgi:quercetin dioxygenase-like cupin family protein
MGSQSFLFGSELKWEDLGGDVHRQILGYNDDLMMVKFRFKKGGVGAPHHHVHSQTAMVISGAFELTIDGQTQLLKAGDGYMVEPNIVHGAVCIEDGEIIDAFNPKRADFIDV